MLCIQHLSEHDKYIDKQIQYQKQLENLWNNYNLIFNEDKIQEQVNILTSQLENHRKLKQEIKNLLLINHFHDSMENDQKFQTAIQTVQKAIEHENQSKLIIRKRFELKYSKWKMIYSLDDVHPKIEEEEDPPTNDCKK